MEKQSFRLCQGLSQIPGFSSKDLYLCSLLHHNMVSQNVCYHSLLKRTYSTYSLVTADTFFWFCYMRVLCCWWIKLFSRLVYFWIFWGMKAKEKDYFSKNYPHPYLLSIFSIRDFFNSYKSNVSIHSSDDLWSKILYSQMSWLRKASFFRTACSIGQVHQVSTQGKKWCSALSPRVGKSNRWSPLPSPLPHGSPGDISVTLFRNMLSPFVQAPICSSARDIPFFAGPVCKGINLSYKKSYSFSLYKKKRKKKTLQVINVLNNLGMCSSLVAEHYC